MASESIAFVQLYRALSVQEHPFVAAGIVAMSGWYRTEAQLRALEKRPAIPINSGFIDSGWIALGKCLHQASREFEACFPECDERLICVPVVMLPS